MPTQKYQEYAPSVYTLELLDQCRAIIESYMGQGLKLSLRQLYYQLVSRNLITNDERSYKRLGGIISRARLAGIIDWSSIEDRNREARVPPQWNSVQDIMEAALRAFRLPRMRGQDTYVEVWVEKAALEGVLAPLGNKRHVTIMVNRGYSSTSAMYESAQRIDRNCRDDNGNLVCSDALVLYLGDLDPSGEDMVRDVENRLITFLNGTIEEDGYPPDSPMGWSLSAVDAVSVRVRKLALTMTQVQQYNPPPNPTKRTDSRSREFIQKYGASSWEVDALPPDVLQQIVTDALDQYIDESMVNEVVEEEYRQKAALRAAMDALEVDNET